MGNNVQAKALADRVVMSIDPTGLTNSEVRASLAHMEQGITMKAHAMTDQVNQQNKGTHWFVPWLTG